LGVGSVSAKVAASAPELALGLVAVLEGESAEGSETVKSKGLGWEEAWGLVKAARLERELGSWLVLATAAL
jgi:hypothetical protein